MRVLPFVVFAAVGLIGCRHTFPTPYSAQQLTEDSRHWPGDALVHYVQQPDADLALCDLRLGAVQRADEDLADPFVTSLEEGTLNPERWGDCGQRLVPSVTPSLREYLLGRLARAVLRLVEQPQTSARILAAEAVLDARPREPSPSLDTLLEKLVALDRAQLAPEHPPVIDGLIRTLELDHGQLHGQPVSADVVMGQQDEGTLLRMISRLPDAALRDAAKRRLISLRIDASPWPEVRARRSDVEAQVFSYGRWAQPPKSLVLARPQPPLALPFTVVVQQDIADQTATFALADSSGVMPTIDLRARLELPVEGFSAPLRLCERAEALRVDPCVDARELEFQGWLQVDELGVARLPAHFSAQQAFELARAGEGVTLAVRLQGRLVTTMSVPVQWAVPDAFFFEAAEGEPGPAVNVVVQGAGDVVLIDGVSEANERRFAVVPRVVGPDSFEFGSRGGRGAQGHRGYDGYAGHEGASGVAASCPSTPATDGSAGGDGGDGSNGGDGGPGGPGGPVSVEVRCTVDCESTRALAKQLIKSRGGRGGAGGRGGSGGSGGTGGSGGAGASCSSGGIPAGNTGARGSDGRDGRSGWSGDDGADGVVEVH